MAWLLVHEWHRLGESIKVVSNVRCAATERRDFPFSVYYRPGPIDWLRLMKWADVFVHMNISLKAYWPRLLVRRPFVAVNHAYYYSDSNCNRRWPERPGSSGLRGRKRDGVTQLAPARRVTM